MIQWSSLPAVLLRCDGLEQGIVVDVIDGDTGDVTDVTLNGDIVRLRLCHRVQWYGSDAVDLTYRRVGDRSHVSV